MRSKPCERMEQNLPPNKFGKLSIRAASRYQWEKIKKKAFRRDNYQCQLCGNSSRMIALAHHHIIPTGRIRFDVPENILTICVFCHRLVHDGKHEYSIDDLIDFHRPRLLEVPNIKQYLRGNNADENGKSENRKCERRSSN